MMASEDAAATGRCAAPCSSACPNIAAQTNFPFRSAANKAKNTIMVRTNQRTINKRQQHHYYRITIIVSAFFVASVSSWSTSPPDRSITSKANSQLESKLRHARTAIVSCWAAGVVLASTSIMCPALAATVPTTQIKIKVETETLERALESRGDLNGAVAQVAESVSASAIRFVPPINSELMNELQMQPEPLVDVDQMFQDVWEDIASVFGSRRRFNNNVLSQSLTVNLPTGAGGKNQEISFKLAPLLVAMAFLSYPLTYAFYQYEQVQEAKKSEAKKAALKAKQAAKQKASKQKDATKPDVQPKKGPKGAKSKESTPSETKAEATPVTAKVEVPLPAPAVLQQTGTAPGPAPPASAPASTTQSPQEGGMDAYAQAYAAMLSTATAPTQPSKESSAPSSAPKLEQPLPVPEPPLLSVEQQPSLAQEAPPPVIVTPPPSPATTSTKQQLPPQGDDGDSAGMSAYEKAYAAMMQNSK